MYSPSQSCNLLSQATEYSYSPTNNSGYSLNYIKIPKSSLGYNTNNVYPIYPPLMSDGRSIVATDQSETIINNNLLKESGVHTNWEYRKYLTDNSEKIREINTLEAFNDVGYYKRFVNFENDHSSDRTPGQESFSVAEEGELKNLYKTRENLNSLIYSPSIRI